MVHSGSGKVAWSQNCVSRVTAQYEGSNMSRRLRVFSTDDSVEERDSLKHSGSARNWTIKKAQVIYKAAGFTL